jgi:2-aminoethylphosphonate-pyruvate transaminase
MFLALSHLSRRVSFITKPQVKLFTPGPLNTSKSVKESMLYDFGSRDPDFGRIVEDIKLRLLRVAGVSEKDYATVLVQGSGTYAVEAALGTAFPRLAPEDRRSKKMLVVANGSYGERQVKICEVLDIPHIVLRYSDAETARPEDVCRMLQEHPTISHVSIVHSETTTGLLNPVEEVGQAVHELNPRTVFMVDGMSSFGALHLDMYRSYTHYLISSSNKMIQGVPGFAFVICRLSHLRQCKGNSRSLSMDLFDQYDYQLQNPGQFRFTPPTHVLSAFYQALLEHEAEGGVKARGERYRKNQEILSTEMRKLGFKLYIDPKDQGLIITTFMQPTHPKFNFKTLYDYLAERNIVIYPGKLSKAPSFRLGNIGELYPADMHECIQKLKEAFEFMGVPLPLTED